MAPGKGCNPVSPGFRRGLFVGSARPGRPGGLPAGGGPPSELRHDDAGSRKPSPGFRRELFVANAPRSPGWKPGDSGSKNHPASHAARLHFLLLVAPGIAWHRERDATRCPLASAGSFLWPARQEAPGGNPGTPGPKTIPPATPHDSKPLHGSGPAARWPVKTPRNLPGSRPLKKCLQRTVVLEDPRPETATCPNRRLDPCNAPPGSMDCSRPSRPSP